MDEYKIRFTNDFIDFNLEKSHNEKEQEKITTKEEEIITKILEIINDGNKAEIDKIRMNVLQKLPLEPGKTESILENLIKSKLDYDTAAAADKPTVQGAYETSKQKFFKQVKQNMLDKQGYPVVTSTSLEPGSNCQAAATEDLQLITPYAATGTVAQSIKTQLASFNPLDGAVPPNKITLQYNFNPGAGAGVVTNTNLNDMYVAISGQADTAAAAGAETRIDSEYPDLYLFVFVYLKEIKAEADTAASAASAAVLDKITVKFTNLLALMDLIETYTGLLTGLQTEENADQIIVKHNKTGKTIYAQEKKYKLLGAATVGTVCNKIQKLQITYDTTTDRFLTYKKSIEDLSIYTGSNKLDKIYFYEIKNKTAAGVIQNFGLNLANGFYLSMDVDLLSLTGPLLTEFNTVCQKKLPLVSFKNNVDNSYKLNLYLKFNDTTQTQLFLETSASVEYKISPIIRDTDIKNITKIEVLVVEKESASEGAPLAPASAQFSLFVKIAIQGKSESFNITNETYTDVTANFNSLTGLKGFIGIDYDSTNTIISYFPGKIKNFTFKDSVGFIVSPIDAMKVDALEKTRDQLYQQITQLKSQLPGAGAGAGAAAGAEASAFSLTEAQLAKVYQYNELSQEYKDLMQEKDKILKQNSQQEVILRSSQNLQKKIKFYHSQIKTIKLITLITHIILAVIIIIAIIYRKLA